MCSLSSINYLSFSITYITMQMNLFIEYEWRMMFSLLFSMTKWKKSFPKTQSNHYIMMKQKNTHSKCMTSFIIHQFRITQMKRNVFWMNRIDTCTPYIQIKREYSSRDQWFEFLNISSSEFFHWNPFLATIPNRKMFYITKNISKNRFGKMEKANSDSL